ncbi:MAG: hypothetical protein UW91_C0044G0001, partial [Parcubacteria group bacterium GW2011_GWF2_45_11]
MKEIIYQHMAVAVCCLSLTTSVLAADKVEPLVTDENKTCVQCHRTQSAALVMEWERSRHGAAGIGCVDCHRSKPDAI